MSSVILTLVLSLGAAQAADFHGAVQMVSAKTDSFVVTAEGDRIDGQIRKISGSPVAIKKLVIEDTSGVKHKLAADDIQRMGNEQSGIARFASKMEDLGSVAETVETADSGTHDAGFAMFETAELKGKTVLMQLVNPDFDSRIRVFADPDGRQTSGVAAGGVQITGGKVKAYRVSKDGAPTELIKKGSYARDFDDLFGDCDALTGDPSLKEAGWPDFADHVQLYDEQCTEP